MHERPRTVEFDRYATEYARLLRDPIRERFAPGSTFFAERKMTLLDEFLHEQGQDPAALGWLDVGCGQGDLLRLGVGRFAQAVGCDPSTGMIRHGADLDVRLQAAPDRLPFESGSFDLLTMVCVLHHVEVAQRADLVREAARVLQPGGVLAIIEHNPLNPITQWIVSRTPVDADAQLLGTGSSRRLLRAGGLEPLATKYFLYFPERFYSRLARVESWLSRLPLGGQYAVFGGKPQIAGEYRVPQRRAA